MTHTHTQRESLRNEFHLRACQLGLVFVIFQRFPSACMEEKKMFSPVGRSFVIHSGEIFLVLLGHLRAKFFFLLRS